jgi:hypothetical protein
MEPKNPETIIIKNKFYPKGLREIDVWNHYQRVKVPLLKELRSRKAMFAIMVDVNKAILKRNIKNAPIFVTEKNYDEIFTGRTVAVYPEMNRNEDFGIIDIDINPNDGFHWAKKTTIDVYDYVMDKMPVVRKASIRFTGKTSFHIILLFWKKNDD